MAIKKPSRGTRVAKQPAKQAVQQTVSSRPNFPPRLNLNGVRVVGTFSSDTEVICKEHERPESAEYRRCEDSGFRRRTRNAPAAPT